MDTRFIHIGFTNTVSIARIIAIISPDSAPIKRIVAEAKEKNMIIDATHGRKTRAVIIADTGHVILSAIMPETVVSRVDIVADDEMKADIKSEVKSEIKDAVKSEVENEVKSEVKNEVRESIKNEIKNEIREEIKGSR